MCWRACIMQGFLSGHYLEACTLAVGCIYRVQMWGLKVLKLNGAGRRSYKDGE